MRRTTASAVRVPDSQAPPTVPHAVSCAASPAKNTRLRIGSVRMRRAPCQPGARARDRALDPLLLAPLRHLGAAERLLHAGAEHAAQPFHGELDHRLVALRGEIAAELSADRDRRQRRAADIGGQRAGARTRRLLEHHVVARQAERIARKFQRDVIEAAEPELLHCVLMALRQTAVELDAIEHHVGGRRDDADSGRRSRPWWSTIPPWCRGR